MTRISQEANEMFQTLLSAAIDADKSHHAMDANLRKYTKLALQWLKLSSSIVSSNSNSNKLPKTVLAILETYVHVLKSSEEVKSDPELWRQFEMLESELHTTH